MELIELLLLQQMLLKQLLLLLLLQAPDLLLLEGLELYLRGRRGRNHEQKADEEQPLQHSGYEQSRRPTPLVVVTVGPANIKRRGRCGSTALPPAQLKRVEQAAD